MLLDEAVATRIALRTRVAAHVVAFFVRPMVRTYERPVAMATLLWAGWVWSQKNTLDRETAAALGAVVILWVARKLAYREANRLPQRYYDAFARGDADEVAALSPLFGLFQADPDERAAYTNMRLGEEMILRKRWAEARAAPAKVDLAHFEKDSQAVILNNLAYTTARNGDPTEAIVLIERAYATADKSPGNKMVRALPSMRATHGIALHLAGRHEEALPLLEVSVDDGSNRVRNERLYWLGRIYRMLGREDDARVAFARAIELGGACTEEARQAIADATPFRG